VAIFVAITGGYLMKELTVHGEQMTKLEEALLHLEEILAREQ